MIEGRRALFRKLFRHNEPELICVRVEDTWRWPANLGAQTEGVCSKCGVAIYFEQQNAPYKKICYECAYGRPFPKWENP